MHGGAGVGLAVEIACACWGLEGSFIRVLHNGFSVILSLRRTAASEISSDADPP